MKKTIWFWMIILSSVMLFTTTSRGDSEPHENKAVTKSGSDADKNLALKFLKGIQSGDKKMMYEAANLTTKMVSDSREKLVHSKQHNLTDQQRLEFEHALRISGQIDFFIAKTRKLFPKSSRFEIIQTTAKDATSDARNTEHLVKITYLNKTEAMRDKMGKPVKEMVIHLQQITRSVNGRSVNAFSFANRDFDKIADRDFEVLSYF